MLKRIKALCDEKGVKSLSALEEKAGLSARTIYRWDDCTPAVDKVQAVAAVLGVTVDELLRDEQNERGA